jgi:uncharacterized protein involved in outer membrane biogenesis
MKRLIRWLFRLVLLTIVLGAALVLLKDILFKAFLESRLRRQTGADLTIRKAELGLLAPTFTVEGLKLYNPPAFGGSVLFDIPEVHLEYDLRQALLGQVHLRLLRFNLHEANLVKNPVGQTNVLAMLARLTEKQPSPPTSPSAPPASPSTGPRTRRLTFGGIDRLYLSLGTVRFTDLGQPQNSWLRAINWKDYEVKGIRNAEDARNWGMLIFLQVAVAPSRPLPAERSRP